MAFHCWVFRRWVLRCWVFRRWVFEAYCREYPTRNLELGIPDVGHSRHRVFQTLGIPYENPLHINAHITYHYLRTRENINLKGNLYMNLDCVA